MHMASGEAAAGHDAGPGKSEMNERIDRMETAIDELRQQVDALTRKIDNLFG
jgi:hypothetical protein